MDRDIKSAQKSINKSPNISDNHYQSARSLQGSDIRVQIQATREKGKGMTTVLGLLDTGTSNNFVTRHTLKYVDHVLSTTNSRVNRRYGSTIIREKATFSIKLPEFASTKTIKLTALVEENTSERHNIVLRIPLLNSLGLKFDYARGIIIWDDVATTMKTISENKINNLSNEDPGDIHLPEFMKAASTKATNSFKANDYKKYNYRDMVLKCNHLQSQDKNKLLDLFSKYENLFNGELGTVPGEPVKLKLKSDVMPYAARPYTVPKAIEYIAKQELQDLVDIGVFIEGIHSEWASPSFFRKKKDSGVHFVSDLRKLNACLQRHPHPLPLIDEVIWRMNGFTYATCLDLNRGYYHFLLDENSRKLCGIVLPWGRYAYARLPQGLMPSSDIFQAKMTQIFGSFEDVIVYIDNILVFTKKTFDHHLQRLEEVLKVLQSNNLHVHVEETFLANSKVDYLGYTLTTEGIRPQI